MRLFDDGWNADAPLGSSGGADDEASSSVSAVAVAIILIGLDARLEIDLLRFGSFIMK